jgi:biotin-[acetyl-CoA-carboxylase] ligase BirA-like protein
VPPGLKSAYHGALSPLHPTTPDEVVAGVLQGTTRFQRLVHVSSCSSTQDLAAAPPHDGDAVFWSDHQTRGRGRQHRAWHDEPAADLAITLRVTLPLPQPMALPAALPVAVCEALETYAGRALRVKWPNDVFCDGRKLCGVLIDAGQAGKDTWLIGVGVNCNRTRFPPELASIATSLALVGGRSVDRGALLLGIAQRVDALLRDLAHDRLERLAAEFRDRLGLMGKQVVVDVGAAHAGTLVAVDFEHVTLDGARTFPLGHVRSLRPA